MTTIVMAGLPHARRLAPDSPRWRRRALVAAVAAAVVALHGWGLGGTGDGQAGELPERVAVVPVHAPVLQTRAVMPVAVTAPQPQAAPEPAALVRPRPAVLREAAAPAQPAAESPNRPPAEPPAEAPNGTPAERPVADEAASADADPPAVAEAAQGEGASAPDPGTPPAAVAGAAALAAVAADANAAPAPSPAAAPPVYATRLAPAFAARYVLSRGMLSGSGSLRWSPSSDGSRYEARLEGSVAGFNVLDWTSTGAIDRAGIAPERYLVRRRGRDAQAANFQRGAGKITYSGPSVQYDLPAGAQDRLSWMLQIGAVLNAAPKRFGVGSRIDFFVTGARGDADLWQFKVIALESVRAAGRDVLALKLSREPRKPYDTRVEVWLDPARDHRPVRARLANGSGDEALELRLDE